MALDRKTQILLAIIPVIGGIIVAYWQFVYKPVPDPDKKASYQGRIIDRDSKQVIEGAKVSVEAKGVPPNVHTDSNGIFHLELSEAPKFVRVRVETAGYVPFNEFVPLTEGKFEDIRLVPSGLSPQQMPTPQPSPPIGKNSSTSSMPREATSRKPEGKATPGLLERRMQALDKIDKRSTPQP